MVRIRQRHCGSLRVTTTEEPDRVDLCHCKACQRSTSTVFRYDATYMKDRAHPEGNREIYNDADTGHQVEQSPPPGLSAGCQLYEGTFVGTTLQWVRSADSGGGASNSGTIFKLASPPQKPGRLDRDRALQFCWQAQRRRQPVWSLDRRQARCALWHHRSRRRRAAGWRHRFQACASGEAPNRLDGDRALRFLLAAKLQRRLRPSSWLNRWGFRVASRPRSARLLWDREFETLPSTGGSSELRCAFRRQADGAKRLR